MVKILLIEDDESTAVALCKGLEREGFTVEHASDGIDGVWLAQEANPDLIVLDVMLPGLDGFGVCSQLRASEVWVPVLMLTALDSESNQISGLDEGADDYLVKPVAFRVLVARIRALLRRVQNRLPAPVTVGDLRVDPARRQVFRRGREIKLTARQFDVLEFLVRHAGLVVSKETILASVWRYDFDGVSNIVEVYVKRVRAAIDEPFGCDSIETIRGVGYRFRADGTTT